MIAGRSSFSGVHLVRRATNVAHVLSQSRGCFQVYVQRYHLSHFRGMNGAKDGSHVMDRQKKRKKVASSWVPISTKSSPEEDSGKSSITVNYGIKSDTSILVRSVHSQPSLTSDAEDLTLDPEAMDDSVRPSVSSINSMSNSGQTGVEEMQGTYSPSNAVGEDMSLYCCVTSDSATVKIISPEKDGIDSLGSELNAGSMDEVERHSVSIEVDASLLRFVKGKGGATQRRIEEELGVKIILPSSREEKSVVIQGSSVENVNKAADKINGVLEEAIKSPLLDYSHFVSLPLAIHPELVQRLNNFQNSVMGDSSSPQDGNVNIDSKADALNNGNDKDSQLDDMNVAVKLEVEDDKEHVKVEIVSTVKRNCTQLAYVLSDLGIDRSIFIKPKTFHLTVLMLKLWNKERVAAATEVLQKTYPKMLEALENRPISIRLKGLECMKGSPAKARVLYAPVEEIGEGRLMRVCQVIREAYVEAGLVLERDAQQTLKLHATLMNVRHRKRKMRGRRHDSFDARTIFKRFGSEDWGEYCIPEIHLSQRFAFGDSGYYHCCASIPFPGTMKTD